ncbi:MAG: folylpolyglutamate synthase [Icmadophila ericetorum]|nr:folylpolyglutamate synthase [Icmadophila ericetorum]
MIELGLGRISRLISESTFPWRAIHVAGTNGKGSVCAYASSMLHASGVPHGMFTSPHLIDRWDCITVNERIVSEDLFRRVEHQVKERDQDKDIKASEFELLTATAFEIFAQEKVEVGVVEVGMGGRLDATNVLKDPLVTVVTKIGKDHETFLGNTVEEIAYQKGGIMKKGIPCYIDQSNPASVLKVLEDCAKEIDAGPVTKINGCSMIVDYYKALEEEIEEPRLTNMSLALHAVTSVLTQKQREYNVMRLIGAAKFTVWPGRLQHLSIKMLTGEDDKILLDGAHNLQSAEVLGSYVDKRLREYRRPITWVLAASHGKDLEGILPHLLKAGDNLVTTKFGAVDGMPWVKAALPGEILANARSTCNLREGVSVSTDVGDALLEAVRIAGGGPVVVAGSLYLVSEVFRLLRSRGGSMEKER